MSVLRGHFTFLDKLFKKFYNVCILFKVLSTEERNYINKDRVTWTHETTKILVSLQHLLLRVVTQCSFYLVKLEYEIKYPCTTLMS